MKEPVVKITLDLHKESVDTAVSLKHGDTGGRIAITLSEGGFPYEITEDCYAVLTAVKPDGNILYNRCEILGNTVFYEVTAQTTALVGRMPAEVKLYGGEDRLITSAAFRILVQEAVCTGEMVESTGEVSALTHLVSQTLDITRRSGELIAAAETAVQMVEQAAEHIEAAVQNANDAAARAEQFLPVAQEASQKAEEASRSVNTLREVVSRFHSNIVETAGGEVVTVSDASGMKLAGLRIFGKTTQNGIPAPEAPAALESVGDDGSVAVTVCGKNLLTPQQLYSQADSYAETTIDGRRCVQMTSGVLVTVTPDFLKPNTQYTVSMTCKNVMKSGQSTSLGNVVMTFYYNDNTNTRLIAYGANTDWISLQQTSDAGKTVASIGLRAYDYRSLTYIDIDTFQLEIGSTATAYEPYKEPQTLAFSTPNGLPGIPVTSGGNYTDGNGQRWLCDEVDFEKGVYVQRIGTHTLNKSATWYWNSSKSCVYTSVPNAIKLDNTNQTERLVSGDKYVGTSWVRLGQADAEYHCSMYYGLSFVAIHDKDCASVDEFLAKLGDNTIEVQYMLATPIETALSAEQLAAFAALHTNYPNTTVFNEEGAGMEVRYVADTKLYIDKKFDQLAAVLVNRT